MSTKKAKKSRKILEQTAEQAAAIRQRPLFQDRLFIGFVLATFALCIAIIVTLIIKVRPKSFVVPLQYSTLRGFDALGPWYRAYMYGLFTLLVSIGNTSLAVMSYPKSRISSFFLMLGTVVVNIFTLVVVLTLAAHLNL